MYNDTIGTYLDLNANSWESEWNLFLMSCLAHWKLVKQNPNCSLMFFAGNKYAYTTRQHASWKECTLNPDIITYSQKADVYSQQ